MRMTNESEEAVSLANRILDTPAHDPDSMESVLSRQFLRALERVKELESYKIARDAAALRIAAEHIPVTFPSEPGDPVWLISRGGCSCGNMKADGVTRWKKLWSDHIRSLIPASGTSALDQLLDEAKHEALSEDFTVQYEEIALQPDDKLTPEAQRLKNAMRAALRQMIRETKIEAMAWCTGAMSLNERDNAIIQKAIVDLENQRGSVEG